MLLLHDGNPSSARLAGRALVAGAAAWLALAPPAAAQDGPGPDRLDAPPFTALAAAKPPVLPPLVLPRAPSTDGLAAGLQVFVREYEIVGNSLLGPEEIDRIVAPYVGRPVSYAELEALRDALTRAYVSRGYVTSGAVLPDQVIEDGRVRIEVQEGDLGEIRVRTDGRLRADYVASRLRPGDGPLNVFELEQRLQWLQQDPRVHSVRASLEPGGRRGEGSLAVELEETRALSARLELDNGLAPSIGAERSALVVEHANLSGFGDTLQLRFGQSHGLRELGARYERPLGGGGTSLALFARGSSSDVVERPFSRLDIESRSATYGATLRHPIHRAAASRLDLSLGLEYRRSKSFLLGSAFSFSRGVEDGESSLAIVRFAQDWTAASRNQVLALRSTLSVGLDALGATTNGDRSVADGRFVAWLGQVQYARRLGILDAQLIARADLQLSNQPLLGLEQFALGGRASVRGYRENALVRDNGASGSLELRVPVWQRGDGSASLELAPFLDAGTSRNRRSPTPGIETLSSAGLGARLELGRVEMELYWADELREVPDTSDERDLQDRGLHVRVTTRF